MSLTLLPNALQTDPRFEEIVTALWRRSQQVLAATEQVGLTEEPLVAELADCLVSALFSLSLRERVSRRAGP